MSQLVQLDPYRKSEAAPLKYREHAPMCGWCVWRRCRPDPLTGHRLGVCTHPTPNPTYLSKVFCQHVNQNGACDHYSPRLGVRILQWLRIIPFVERSPRQP